MDDGLVRNRIPNVSSTAGVLRVTRGNRDLWGIFRGRWFLLRLRFSFSILLLLSYFCPTVFEPDLDRENRILVMTRAGTQVSLNVNAACDTDSIIGICQLYRVCHFGGVLSLLKVIARRYT